MFNLQFTLQIRWSQFSPIRTLDSSNDVLCFVLVPFQDLEPLNLLFKYHRTVSGPKNTKISTRFRTWPIYSGNCFSIRALKSKLPLNVKITPQNLDFRLEVTNQKFLSHSGDSTGSLFSKMAAAAIWNFENWLPFLYYSTNCHQV